MKRTSWIRGRHALRWKSAEERNGMCDGRKLPYWFKWMERKKRETRKCREGRLSRGRSSGGEVHGWRHVRLAQSNALRSLPTRVRCIGCGLWRLL
ncbi:hypothetical protein NPIL_235511 [Nephila pilipes]|uniref:Uncharacterized protein n=1 Tax=Nephila pilipes TaxID=299642 RepID=A0A8X6PAL3_NEPPI|nr:hypothetical protein NPIL_235511 [Nephila pilipes]